MDKPDQITTEEYWKRSNGTWILRRALNWDHPENLYNWAKRTYPDLDPEDYGIEKPQDTRVYVKGRRCPHCKHEIGDVECEEY